MSVCNLWCKLTCVDVIYLLCIAGSILTALAFSPRESSTSTNPIDSGLAATGWVFSGLQGLGIFNRVVYSVAVLSKPQRTDRVTQLIHFNLGAITGISAAVATFNIVILAIALTNDLTLAALVFNVVFLLFEKYYGRRFLKKHEQSVVREREALPLRHKRVLSYNTLAANWLPLSWIVYLVTFLPLYCYI